MNNFDTLDHNATAIQTALTHNFWDVLFAHPVLYIGYVFTFVATIAFLTFLRGFLSGFSYVITMDWNEEHQMHYRVYATWGVMMLLYIFIVWEIVRWVLSWFM